MSHEPPQGRTADRPARPAAATAPRTVARLARQLELALATVDLSPSQYRVLMFLDEIGSAAASALAGRLDVTRPSITALVDGLEARGLVERHPQMSDRRRVEVVLSDAGHDALDAADAAVADRLEHIAAHLPPTRSGAGTATVVDTAGLVDWSDALDAKRAALLAAS